MMRRNDSGQVFLVLLGLTMAACASHERRPNAALPTPAAGRITDEAILGDARAFAALEHRVQTLNERGTPLSDYRLAKAQALIDFARDEYEENDRSSIIEQTLEEATRLVAALEASRPATFETVRFERAEPVRLDLWAGVDQLKAHPRFGCAAAAVARVEVALLQADHEMHDGGWRRARPHVQVAEAEMAAARAALVRCGENESCVGC